MANAPRLFFNDGREHFFKIKWAAGLRRLYPGLAVFHGQQVGKLGTWHTDGEALRTLCEVRHVLHRGNAAWVALFHTGKGLRSLCRWNADYFERFHSHSPTSAAPASAHMFKLAAVLALPP